MADELLPCPFCGGEARFKVEPESWGYHSGSVEVQCSKCSASAGRYFDASMKQSAAEAWNTRHQPNGGAGADELVDLGNGIRLPMWVIQQANAIGAYLKATHGEPWKLGPIQSRTDDDPSAGAEDARDAFTVRAIASAMRVWAREEDDWDADALRKALNSYARMLEDAAMSDQNKGKV